MEYLIEGMFDEPDEALFRVLNRMESDSSARNQAVTDLSTCNYNFFPSKGNGFSKARGVGVNTDLSYMNSVERNNYQQAYVDLFNTCEWKYFITFTFMHNALSENEASTIVGKFINKLSAAAFGSRSKKRVKVAASLERFLSGDVHVHLVMEDIVSRIHQPEKASQFDVRNEVIKAWRDCHDKTTSPLRSDPTGFEWFKEIYALEKALIYIVKDVKKGSDPVAKEELSLEGRRFR